jgi:hypothetical protein
MAHYVYIIFSASHEKGSSAKREVSEKSKQEIY